MPQTVLLWLLFGIVAAALVLRALLRTRRTSTDDPEIRSLDAHESKLREKYRNSLAAGQKTRPLARVYSQVDLSLMKSLLDSKEIPSDLLFGTMNTLRTGVAIQGFNDCIVVVLEDDYEAGREIVQDYVDTLRKGPSRHKAGTVIRNMAEVIVSLILVNPAASWPEIL